MGDGMLYTHPDSTGIVNSYFQVEAEWGWPTFPMKVEEQNAFWVGKRKESNQRLQMATGRFVKVFVDDESGASCDETVWKAEIDKFYAPVKSGHSNPKLNVLQMQQLLGTRGVPFTPTVFRKVDWMMSFA